MAITTFRRSVGTTPTLLYAHPKTTDSGEGDYNAKHVALINADAAQATVYLGDSAVDTTTGARWVIDAGRTLSIELEVGESLYAVVVTGTQAIDVLVNGR